jgi:N-acetylmuramoyl-L-alanine amidase
LSYTLRESQSSKNYTPHADVPATFGYQRDVQYITWHHWGALGQNFYDVENFLCTNNTPTSAHYIMQAGLVSCIVTPDDAAWHSGNARGNAQSVGVEAHPEATEADYQTGAELVRFIRSLYGDIPIVPHNYWFNTACPGKWDLAKLDRMARALGTTAVKPASATVKPAPKPAPKPAVTVPSGPVAATGLSWVVQAGDSLPKIAAHYGITVATLAGYNKINAKASLKIGLRLHIPGPLVWTVEAGDTLGEIAKHYAVDVNVLAAKNGIKNVNALRVGQVIKVL